MSAAAVRQEDRPVWSRFRRELSITSRLDPDHVEAKALRFHVLAIEKAHNSASTLGPAYDYSFGEDVSSPLG